MLGLSLDRVDEMIQRQSVTTVVSLLIVLGGVLAAGVVFRAYEREQLAQAPRP